MDVAAIIFDMDGVLVDSEPIHLEAMRQVLAPHGISYTDAENEAFFGFTDVEVFRALAARDRIPADEHRLTAERTALLVRLIGERAVPMPGVTHVLARLRAAGFRLALASSSAPEVIATTLETIGAAGYFDPIVSGLAVGRGKPAPDIFLETARRLGVPPHRCLVVEDSRNGVLAARAAGMACAALPCPATVHQDFSAATFRLATLPDLLAILAA